MQEYLHRKCEIWSLTKKPLIEKTQHTRGADVPRLWTSIYFFWARTRSHRGFNRNIKVKYIRFNLFKRSIPFKRSDPLANAQPSVCELGTFNNKVCLQHTLLETARTNPRWRAQDSLHRGSGCRKQALRGFASFGTHVPDSCKVREHRPYWQLRRTLT